MALPASGPPVTAPGTGEGCPTCDGVMRPTLRLADAAAHDRRDMLRDADVPAGTCPRLGYVHRVEHALGGASDVYNASPFGASECRRRAVDWRARSIADRAALDAATLRARESKRLGLEACEVADELNPHGMNSVGLHARIAAIRAALEKADAE